ncbi:hypothetical protein PSTT_08600 [Puccinia striiformis]|uniref:Uncharacterized protein n=1 Tax=Puccinia striiformis TaxID=27350 RepID=A0A2S4VBT1_9BASI|nr:hypothetical protein PSTT_08600 [Puccinia striiformis]
MSLASPNAAPPPAPLVATSNAPSPPTAKPKRTQHTKAQMALAPARTPNPSTRVVQGQLNSILAWQGWRQRIWYSASQAHSCLRQSNQCFSDSHWIHQGRSQHQSSVHPNRLPEHLFLP